MSVISRYKPFQIGLSDITSGMVHLDVRRMVELTSCYSPLGRRLIDLSSIHLVGYDVI